jgi:hypothetical protein
MPLIDERRPIGAHISTDMPSLGADHLATERPDYGSFGQVIGVDGDTLVTVDGAAIDQDASAAVRADMAKRHRLESLALALSHTQSRKNNVTTVCGKLYPRRSIE